MILALAGCAPLIAGYSLDAYKNGTSLKADVLALVAKGGDPYSAHTSDINALTVKLNEAYEFSKGETTNALSTAQWSILINPQGHLYGGFVSLWKSEGHLSPAEVNDQTALLSRAFDQIICLEANKQQPTKCPAT